MSAQTDTASDTWTVAGRTFSSRLIVGTGKYADYAQNAAAAEAAGAEIVTVALRRARPETATTALKVGPAGADGMPTTFI